MRKPSVKLLSFTSNLEACYTPVSVLYGGIAQLVERLHGMQEVSGSIPLTSTTISL